MDNLHIPAETESQVRTEDTHLFLWPDHVNWDTVNEISSSKLHIQNGTVDKQQQYSQFLYYSPAYYY